MPHRGWLSLSDAALRAGMNRERLLRLIQGGRVAGRRNVTGRWEVKSISLEGYLAGKAPLDVLPEKR
jgi:hypothetical protein